MPTAQVCAPLYLLDHGGLRLDMAPVLRSVGFGAGGWIYVEEDTLALWPVAFVLWLIAKYFLTVERK